MDKETLSNYGWIVICVIIVAAMIVFAPTFTQSIKDAVTDVVTKLTAAGSTALASI